MSIEESTFNNKEFHSSVQKGSIIKRLFIKSFYIFHIAIMKSLLSFSYIMLQYLYHT